MQGGVCGGASAHAPASRPACMLVPLVSAMSLPICSTQN